MQLGTALKAIGLNITDEYVIKDSYTSEFNLESHFLQWLYLIFDIEFPDFCKSYEDILNFSK